MEYACPVWHRHLTTAQTDTRDTTEKSHEHHFSWHGLQTITDHGHVDTLEDRREALTDHGRVDTLEDRREALTECFFKRSVIPETPVFTTYCPTEQILTL